MGPMQVGTPPRPSPSGLPTPAIKKISLMKILARSLSGAVRGDGDVVLAGKPGADLVDLPVTTLIVSGPRKSRTGKAPPSMASTMTAAPFTGSPGC